MIFVTVGTTAFESLVKSVDCLKNEEIIIQKANGKYEPKNYEFFTLTDKLDEYFEKAEIIITHGGAGNLFKLLKMKKKIIGVANEERTDKHQWDILKKLSEDGYLVWCQNLNNIPKCIKNVRNKKFKNYQQPEDKIADSIRSYFKES